MRPGACLGGKVALVGGLQTSAVGRPIEHVAAATQALEAARGVDADVVAGPLEGALVDVCVATGRESVGSSGWRGHRLPLRHLKSISAWTAPGAQPVYFLSLPGVAESPLTPRFWVGKHLTSFLGVGRVEMF